jgi:hypothetical protein
MALRSRSQPIPSSRVRGANNVEHAPDRTPPLCATASRERGTLARAGFAIGSDDTRARLDGWRGRATARHTNHPGRPTDTHGRRDPGDSRPAITRDPTRRPRPVIPSAPQIGPWNPCRSTDHRGINSRFAATSRVSDGIRTRDRRDHNPSRGTVPPRKSRVYSILVLLSWSQLSSDWSTNWSMGSSTRGSPQLVARSFHSGQARDSASASDRRRQSSGRFALGRRLLRECPFHAKGALSVNGTTTLVQLRACGLIHTEAWVGCTARLTASSRSARIASISTASRSRAVKAATVASAS